MLEESSKADEAKEEQRLVKHIGPGDIGPPKQPASALIEKEKKQKDPNAIWDEDEVDDASLLSKVPKSDNRAR